MYAIVYTRGDKLPREKDFVYCGSATHAMDEKSYGATMRSHQVFHTLKEARNARVVTGDLVIDSATLRVCQSKAWLWKWEWVDKNSYPQRMMRKDY